MTSTQIAIAMKCGRVVLIDISNLEAPKAMTIYSNDYNPIWDLEIINSKSIVISHDSGEVVNLTENDDKSWTSNVIFKAIRESAMTI